MAYLSTKADLHMCEHARQVYKDMIKLIDESYDGFFIDTDMDEHGILPVYHPLGEELYYKKWEIENKIDTINARIRELKLQIEQEGSR